MPNQRDGLLLGIDIGGTSLRVVLAESTKRILKHRKVSSPADESPEVMVRTISRISRELLKDAGGGTLSAVGLSSPGPVDTTLGMLVNPPNLRQYQQVPLRDLLYRELEAPVRMENDANAAALAESRLGCGQGVENLVYVTVSTGIGGGIIAGGRLYHGARGGAGEVGHITIDVNGPSCGCGKHGCWESLGSGMAINREAIRRIEAGEESILAELARKDPRAVDAKAVHQAALKGDRLSNQILDRVAFYMGVGLGSVVNVFNPELVVVGGGLTQMGPRLLNPAFRICRERISPLHNVGLRLEVSRLGDDVALLGALVLAQELRDEE